MSERSGVGRIRTRVGGATAAGILLAMMWLGSSALAAGGFHWHKQFVIAGKAGHGVGTTCSRSRFSDWHWQATVRLSKASSPFPKGTTFNYHWIEPVRADHRAHHLKFTQLSGTFVNVVAPAKRRALVAQLKRRLDRSTVTYVVSGGKDYLSYDFGLGVVFKLRFNPSPGC